ncbi:MAG TPA: tetratricopeptide repeat protein [Rickettsia endosymbiont of Omalisus fontisbellaquei]|nr:tetratricopeptide repeat protein [Rickettsia endosymbiont of Omalisus fontisbellaquei]
MYPRNNPNSNPFGSVYELELQRLQRIEQLKQQRNDYVNKAKASIDIGENRQAISLLDQAIRIDSNCAVAYLNKGLALSNLGDDRQAIAHYNKVFTLQAENSVLALAHNNKSKSLIALQDYSNALNEAQAAINLNPQFSIAYVNKGQALFRMGNNELAIQAYDQAIRYKPDCAEAYCNKSQALIQLKKFSDALTAIEIAIGYNPSEIYKDYFTKGEVLIGLKRNVEAINAFTQSIAQKHDFEPAYLQKSVAWSNLGDLKNALNTINQLLSLKPDCVDGHFYKAAVLVDLTEFIEALRSCESIIKLDPTYKGLPYVQSMVLAGLGKYQDALNLCDKTTKTKQDFAGIYYNKAQIFTIIGQYQTGLDECDKAIGCKSDYVEAYNTKGEILFFMGQYEKAQQEYDKAIRYDKDNAEAYSNKAEVLYIQGKYKEALKLCDQAITLKNTLAGAYNIKANILITLGQNQNLVITSGDPKEEAIICYDQAIELKPKEVRFYCEKGKALKILGRNKEALECFDKALSLSKTPYNLTLTFQFYKDYINKVLSQDREQVLKILNEKQITVIETPKIITNSEAQKREAEKQQGEQKKIEELFKEVELLQKALKALENKIQNNYFINPTDKAEIQNSINAIFDKMQYFTTTAEIDKIKQTTTILQDLTKANQLNNNQLKQEIFKVQQNVDNIVKRQDQTELRVEKVEIFFQKALAEIREKIKESKNSIDDKVIMQDQINEIADRLNMLDKSVVNMEEINANIQKLYKEQDITKHNLIELDQVINDLLDSQKQTDTYIEKFNAFLSTVEDIRSKIKSDITSQVQKNLSESLVKDITIKVRDLNKEDIEKVTNLMKNLVLEGANSAKLAKLDQEVIRISEEQKRHATQIKTHTKIIIDIKGTLNLLEEVTKSMQDQVNSSTMAENQRKEIHEAIMSLDVSVKNIIKRVDVQDPIMQEITENMKDLLTRKENDTKAFLTLRHKIKVIEHTLENSTKVMKIDKVTYDNKLLNHPELLMEVIKIFGASKAVELSKGLSENLLQEAINNNDIEVVIGGMMSLEH